MYGESVGTLRVFNTSANGTVRELIWEMSGKFSDDQSTWSEASIPFANQKADFMLEFEAIKSSRTQKGYIAYNNHF